MGVAIRRVDWTGTYHIAGSLQNISVDLVVEYNYRRYLVEMKFSDRIGLDLTFTKADKGAGKFWNLKEYKGTWMGAKGSKLDKGSLVYGGPLPKAAPNDLPQSEGVLPMGKGALAIFRRPCWTDCRLALYDCFPKELSTRRVSSKIFLREDFTLKCVKTDEEVPALRIERRSVKECEWGVPPRFFG